MYIDKKRTLALFILLIILLIPFVTIADNGNDKLDKQNNYLYDKIMENKKDSDDQLDYIFDDLDKSDQEKGKSISINGITYTLYSNSIYLSILARKYIVPITLLVLFFNLLMLSVTGAKSIKNRKKYILGSVLFYVFYLIVLNFPIYLLWRQSIGIEGFLSFEGLYKFVEGLTLFLKDNSFVLFVIIFTFGVLNRISSETNLTKRLASDFMIKMSFVLLILFNLMPYLLKMAI